MAAVSLTCESEMKLSHATLEPDDRDEKVRVCVLQKTDLRSGSWGGNNLYVAGTMHSVLIKGGVPVSGVIKGLIV